MPVNCGSDHDNCKLMQGTYKGFKEIKQLFYYPRKSGYQRKR